ncbi:13830_t:CDS:10 [Dentiscutata erythropus]|uniref:sn-1-specific diacylglycerol lipase n=1 Tax=Dentiscutata erythropus TaxID=1348616 RepID=A0A9N8VMY2_9GLOM|nr:13830_t:CDS:10 [Dentiscutata erythropus]
MPILNKNTSDENSQNDEEPSSSSENVLIDPAESGSLPKISLTETADCSFEEFCENLNWFTSDNVRINSRCFYKIDESGKKITFENKRHAIRITRETSFVERNNGTTYNSIHSSIDAESELYQEFNLEDSFEEQVNDNLEVFYEEQVNDNLGGSFLEQVNDNIEGSFKEQAKDNLEGSFKEQAKDNHIHISKNTIPDQILVSIKSLQFDLSPMKSDFKKSIHLATQYASHNTKPAISLKKQMQKAFLFPFNYHSMVFDTLKLDFYIYESLLNTKKRFGRVNVRLNVLRQAILDRSKFEGTFPIENNELFHPYDVGTVQISIRFHFRNDPALTSMIYRSSFIRNETLPMITHGMDGIGEAIDHENLNLIIYPEAKSISIFNFILSKSSMDAINELAALCKGFTGHGWRVTKLEFMKAYLLLEKYYDQKPNHITGNLVKDIDKFEKATYYLKFSIASYGSFLFTLFGYGYGLAPKNAVRMHSDRKTIQDYFSISKDDIICWEFGKMTISVPNYMIIRDPKTNSIIISIRGTLNAADVITDVLAYYEPWKNGFVHRGMLRSAQYLVKKSLKDIQAAVKKFKVNSIQVIGHSLGAAISGLVTILLRKRCKDLIADGIDIHAWCFAPPPCCSLDIACKKETMTYIDNFVNENDIVPRLSYGSFIDFKELIKFVVHELKNDNYKKMSSKDKLSALMASIGDYHKNLISNSREQKLYIPGTIYYIYKKRDSSNPLLRRVLCEKSKQESFTDISLRRNWLLHHLPEKYDKRLGKFIKRLAKKSTDGKS